MFALQTIDTYKKGRSIRIRIETNDVYVEREVRKKNKKGRSIRIRIETLLFFVLFQKLINIKKEDPLE